MLGRECLCVQPPVKILGTVLVILDCYHKLKPQRLGHFNSKHYFSLFWRLGRPRSGSQLMWGLVCSCLLCGGGHLPIVSQCGREQRVEANSFKSLLIWALIPSRSIYLEKAPSPKTIILGIRVPTYGFGGWGNTHFQSIAHTESQ